MKIELNGKALLAIGMLSAGLAFGDFVSLVDHRSAGGFSIEKETMTVGSVVLRIDDKNPSSIYGGTWELIQGDAALRLGSGSSYNGDVIGNSNVNVPLPAHTHNFIGNQLPPHSHDYTRSRIADVNDHSASQGRWLQANVTLKTSGVSAGTPTGTLTKSGIDNAKINVKGSYIYINVWKRIS